MTAPLVFLDLETTGLDPWSDEIWEFAAIRRDLDGKETPFQAIIEHDASKMMKQPESFRNDHMQRFNPAEAITRTQFVDLQWQVFGKPENYRDRCQVVGLYPGFDTMRLEVFLDKMCYGKALWYHQPIDVEILAVGWLTMRKDLGLLTTEDDALLDAGPPWRSDELSRALGVPVPGPGVRHTAMGDVRWSMAMYDMIMQER